MQIQRNNFLQLIFSDIDEGKSKDTWDVGQALTKIIRTSDERIENDYMLAKSRMAYIFSKNNTAAQSVKNTCQLMHDWHGGKDVFQTPSMVLVALENFGLVTLADDVIEIGDPADEPLVHAMLAASVLAEVPNNLPYHNNLHFRKVLLHVVRIIAAHNDKLFAGTTHCLEKVDIAKLIISACIHDIGHEGKGNIVDQKYHLAMIERRSFSYAYPYLEAAGLNKTMLDDIEVMLMTTDVSPIGDPISPVNQLRAAYEYHFGMEEEKEDCEEDESVLSEELSILMDSSHLCLLCVLLQEADIMNSASVGYDITRHESVAISEEIGLSHSLPEDTLLFLETICNKKMLSDAGRYLAEEKLASITQRVIEDYRSGNKSYC